MEKERPHALEMGKEEAQTPQEENGQENRGALEIEPGFLLFCFIS